MRTSLRAIGWGIAWIPALAMAQTIGDRHLVVQEITVPGMPALQSFAWGEHEGQWFLIGGRTDGLHRRQPPFSFLAADNNMAAYVVDPMNLQVWSASIASLPQGMVEQLQSTNLQFEQHGNTLYCIGGYGYSTTAGDHITFPNLTAVDLPGVMDAIRNGLPISAFFRQIADPRMEVTGGQLRRIGDHFYLAGGQRFIGRYNPMGPDFGPGFFQAYTNAIRRFTILDDGTDLAIADHWEVVDSVVLHRRDLNVLPQVFPDGSEGLTMFSGVFQYGSDLPWLDVVDIIDTNYAAVPVFEQRLNQYHSAHASVWDSVANEMSSLFFGGMARYYYDSSGTLWDDINVPFVRTISMVRRDAGGTLSETQVGLMPALLGASAELIPWASTPHLESGILKAHQFSGDTVVVGHIVGGIESSAPNIFWVNTGSESVASDRVFRVLLVQTGATGVATSPARPAGPLIRIGTNELMITWPGGGHGAAMLSVRDALGRTVLSREMPANAQTWSIDLSGLGHGSYTAEVAGASGPVVWKFVH